MQHIDYRYRDFSTYWRFSANRSGQLAASDRSLTGGGTPNTLTLDCRTPQ